MSQQEKNVIEVEHHFQQRIMVQKILGGTDSLKANIWKKQWMDELGKWHSPYTLVLVSEQEVPADTPFWGVLAKQADFFKKFFLKKVVLAGEWIPPSEPNSESSWVICPDLESALQKAGWRGKRSTLSGGFRSQIQFESFFKQNVLELSFASSVVVDTSAKIQAVKAKLTNQLMQWHSPWSLLINCGNLEVGSGLLDEFGSSLESFKKLYMLKMIGYSPASKDAQYPFKVYRSRHKAAAELDSASAIAGDTANCSSRKP